MDNVNLQVDGEEININKSIVATKKINIWETSKYFSGPGVYVIFDRRDTILYIGKANDIATRLLKHLKGYDKRTKILENYLYTVRMYAFDNLVNRDIYEIYLIDRKSPILNKQFLYREMDIKKYIFCNESCRYNEWRYHEQIASRKNISLLDVELFNKWCKENGHDVNFNRIKNWIKNNRENYIKKLLEHSPTDIDIEEAYEDIWSDIRGEIGPNDLVM